MKEEDRLLMWDGKTEKKMERRGKQGNEREGRGAEGRVGVEGRWERQGSGGEGWTLKL